MTDQIETLAAVTLVPAPDGYFLDTWIQADPGAPAQDFRRYKFSNVQQVASFSSDTRRVALLATHYEELSLRADEVQLDDLLPFLAGAKVYTVDSEEVHADEVGSSLPGEPYILQHFTFSGTKATVSIPATDRVSVLRRIS